ncbi:MAG: pilus assembly protein, partial [Rhodanobacter sp.]
MNGRVQSGWPVNVEGAALMSSAHKSISRHGAAGAAQRGAVLVIALIFLLLLTILAVAASNRTLLQERMAGGLLNAQRAQMSAQTALRGAEWKLWSSAANVGTSLGCGTGSWACYIYDPLSPIPNVENFRKKPGWVTLGSDEYRGRTGSVDFTTTTYGKLADNPHYMVEYLGQLGAGGAAESGATSGGVGTVNFDVYRITARATGGNKNTVSVLESTF